MPTSLRKAVIAAKERLRQQRQRLKERHDAGSLGVQVCAMLTDMLDGVVLDIYSAILAELNDPDLPQHLSLVAHGGFGRRDVAPYSDVDLMLLIRQGDDQHCQPLAKRLVQDLYDAGLQAGFSMRDPDAACKFAQQQPEVFTSLVESRYLAGSIGLYTSFFSKFRRVARRQSQSMVERICEARRAESMQFGDTVYLLQPNVKRSAGGLRDLQLLRWIGFARFGEAELDHLVACQAMTSSDLRRIRETRDFLLRLRNELHFHAGKPRDVFSKEEQLRIASLWGYQGEAGVLPVEQLMRDYFEHTSEALFRVRHFVDGLRRGSLWTNFAGALFSRRLDNEYRIGPRTIRATHRGLERLQADLSEVLRLMELANAFDKFIDHATWNAIRIAMTDQEVVLTPAAASRFLSLLSQPFRLAELLRRLHQLRVLEKIIPAMKRARSLLQFNEYHKYTVDEHSFRAVQAATDFLHDSGPLGETYRQIADKRILHLALLLHDLGKGYEEDHSEVGLRIAAATATELGLGPAGVEDVKFLVHRHLYMAHTAFRHDFFDEDVLLKFTREVGRLDLLRMLFVLSCADLAAVGPGVLNRWKLSLLTQLYLRTVERLEADAGTSSSQTALTRHADARKLKPDDISAEWWSRCLQALPASYLFDRPSAHLAELMKRIHSANEGQPIAWGEVDEEARTLVYTVVVPENVDFGAFHRLTGALSSKGHEILKAEIHTLPGTMVLRSFHVNDNDHAFPPPPDRLSSMSAVLLASLTQPNGQPPVFRRTWTMARGESPELKTQPIRVRIDTSSSPRFTIVTVFAYDRTGLLYDIAKSLFDLRLPVRFAKIGTYHDQVVDVFYVTNEQGEPLGEDRREEVRERLLSAVRAEN